MPIADVMSPRVVSVQPDETVHVAISRMLEENVGSVTVCPDVEVVDAARLMSERKIRHLPVLQGEHLLGVVGIREVMRSLVEHLWRKHDPDVRETARGLLEREPSATS